MIKWLLKSILISFWILFATSPLFAYASKSLVLCIGETTVLTQRLCQDFNRTDFHPIQKVIPSPADDAKYIEAVSEIQQEIRNAIHLYQHPYRELPHII